MVWGWIGAAVLRVVLLHKRIVAFRARQTLRQFTSRVTSWRCNLLPRQELNWQRSSTFDFTVVAFSLSMYHGTWTVCLLISRCHEEVRRGRYGGGEVTHSEEGASSQQGWEIVWDLYVLWLMGNFYCSLGHNHMPTGCLRKTNCIHKLLPEGSALIWRAGQTETVKKNAFLTEWADKHSRLHKNRKGCMSQCLPAEGTENTHQGAILRKLSSTMSKGSERTRTCCRQNTNIYSCNEKKGLWKSDIKTYVRSPCSRFQTYLGPKDILGREGNKVWQPWHIYLII